VTSDVMMGVSGLDWLRTGTRSAGIFLNMKFVCSNTTAVEKRKNVCEIQTAKMVLLISDKWCNDGSEWTGLAKDRDKKCRAFFEHEILVSINYGELLD
jgi:hypothetical protein